MLKPLKQKFKQKNNIGFDIETNVKNKNRFVVGSFYFSEDEQYIFYNVDDVIKFILNNHKKFRNSTIWCHNLSFDFLGTFFETKYFKDFIILQRGSDFILAQTYVYDNKFHYMLHRSIRDKKKNFTKIIFYDTFSFYKSSLARIGKIINIEKLKQPNFLGKNPKNKTEWEELIKYNLRDSEICKKFADFLQKSFKSLNCNIKSTIASTSMDLFRRNYLKNFLWTPDKKQLNNLYKGYYGGRTEILKRGQGIEKINVYDFNSLYPYVMKNFEYPFPNTMHKAIKIKKSQIIEYEGLTKVDLISNDSFIPYLPLRKEKLIFPNGIIKGVYTNYEIRNALEFGYRIKKIYSGYYFTKTFSPFKEFVDKLYTLRKNFQKLNNPMEMPVKILMNSLYGKFAQSIYDKSEIVHAVNITSKDYHNETTKPLGDSKFFRVKKEYKRVPNFINPIISIYVTAYARNELYKILEKIQDNIFYMDTDSVFTTKKLKTSNRIGKLKFEYSSKEYVLVKPKFYGLITNKNKVKIKIKGFQTCPQNYNKFIDFIKHPKVNYKRFMKFRECLIRNMIPNEMQNMEKIFNLEDNKRLWNQQFNYKDFEDSKPLTVI